ncbi:hypothetical protein VTN02DRAFT_1456 [Thermoascus thermophilus]
MASRGSPDVLPSTSSISLDQHHDFYPPSKKRKLSYGDSKRIYTSSFSIRAHASSPSDRALTFEPIVLLPRWRLPLSWLDVSSGSSPIQPGHLFVANIPDLENDLAERGESRVLTARLTSDGGLYVIERVKRGIYALCNLGHWVGEGDLFVAAKAWSSYAGAERPPLYGSSDAGNTVNWRDAAKIEEGALNVGSSTKWAGLDVSVAFGPGEKAAAHPGSTDTAHDGHPADSEDVGHKSGLPPAGPVPMARSFSTEGGAPTPPEEQGDAALRLSRTSLGGDESLNASDAVQSPEELLDGLRSQYLEALYISKTSVAYFAKGPLARCRAAFQASDQTYSVKSEILTDFYREAILPVKKMDLKYKETLPAMIQHVALTVSDDELTSRTKKRKSKKKKLGKDGLYSEEEEFIRKWWKSRSVAETAESTTTTREQEAKRHIADLRLRETQLQILLILETIALESVSSGAQKESVNDDLLQGQSAKKSKSKKQQDLNVLLELLLDRLCIWHAVSFEDTVIPDSAAKTDDENHLSGKRVESDMLRDFCTEVIIPFYAARLPEQCKSIKRKLGGPSISSPPRPAHHAKGSSKMQSGSTAAKQQQLQKSRRTLQRVLTDEKTASLKRHPPLLRSNTAPSVQDVKRESLEPSLPLLSTSVRGGIQKPKRVDNREVDLNAVAKQHEAKLRKMNMLMEQKKELDAAINALRKPNRELIAKDIAETAERRVSSSSARKSKNPVRNPLGQGVQVMATPKGSRKKEVSVGLPALSRGPVRSSVRKEGTPPSESDVSMVPASAVRPNYHPTEASVSESPLNVNIGRRDVNPFHETPTKSSSKPPNSLVSMIKEGSGLRRDSNRGNDLFKVPYLPPPPRSAADFAPSTPVRRSTQPNRSTPSDNMPSMVQETPPRFGPGLTAPTGKEAPVVSSPPRVFDTPVKGGTGPSSTAAPTAASSMSAEKSIYEQLGWNDDDDELAL